MMRRSYRFLTAVMVCTLPCTSSFGSVGRRGFIQAATALLGLARVPAPSLLPASAPVAPVVNPLAVAMQRDYIRLTWKSFKGSDNRSDPHRLLDVLSFLNRFEPERVHLVSAEIQKLYSDELSFIESTSGSFWEKYDRFAEVRFPLLDLLEKLPDEHTIHNVVVEQGAWRSVLNKELEDRVFAQVLSELPAVYDELAIEFRTSVTNVHRAILFAVDKQAILRAAENNEFILEPPVFSDQFADSLIRKVARHSLSVAYELIKQNRAKSYSGEVDRELFSQFNGPNEIESLSSRTYASTSEFQMALKRSVQKGLGIIARAEIIIKNLEVLKDSAWAQEAIEDAQLLVQRTQALLVELPRKVRERQTKQEITQKLPALPSTAEWMQLLTQTTNAMSMAQPIAERVLSKFAELAPRMIQVSEACMTLLEAPADTPMPPVRTLEGEPVMIDLISESKAQPPDIKLDP